MNAKIVKTKQALLDAFCHLAETIPIEEITVTQLCQEAGVNRTTFYRYYNIPMDVITQKAEELTQQTLGSASHPMEETYDFLLHICQCYYENRQLMNVYLKASGSLFPLYYDLLIRYFTNIGILLDPTNNFIAGGVSSTIMTWMIQGCKTPPEEIAQYIYDCISKLTNK